jgi:hypothetical protein
MEIARPNPWPLSLSRGEKREGKKIKPPNLRFSGWAVFLYPYSIPALNYFLVVRYPVCSVHVLCRVIS